MTLRELARRVFGGHTPKTPNKQKLRAAGLAATEEMEVTLSTGRKVKCGRNV